MDFNAILDMAATTIPWTAPTRTADLAWTACASRPPTSWAPRIEAAGPTHRAQIRQFAPCATFWALKQLLALVKETFAMVKKDFSNPEI